ncbi:PAS domain S-box protein [Pseudogemmatithrix spongiicola]|uniref:histidine kinase n=1 Tax=Pseudogemmatithrix spongiicola TaxID=3062599 RepID=A0AA49JTI1_9BACT|nr:PAS domain S-box protein [Gemmatimonadaceae bacterium 'strain 138']WKW14641.1 PAS domain S-box protein [Gemmatimonadaceae bacterium 'strain 318']
MLVVDDDWEDYLLIRSALEDLGRGRFACDYVADYAAGLEALRTAAHDVCLLDYRLGARSGLELLRDAIAAGCHVPVVMVTGEGDDQVDAAAMELGAADFLTKQEITGPLLARVIRHAITRADDSAELRRRDERHRALLEHLSDSVLVLDADARVTYASPAAAPMLGWTPDELAGQDMFTLLHPEDVPYARERFAACLSEPGLPLQVECRVRHRRADYRTIEVIAVNRLNAPSVRGVVASFRDVTERKQAQAALREARDTLQTLIDSAPLAIISLDLTGRVLTWNRTAEGMFGWLASEVSGRTPPFLNDDQLSEFQGLIGRVTSGETLKDVEVSRHRRDGTPIEIALFATPVRGPDGRVQRVLSMLMDNTERKSLQSQLAVAQKVEAVGGLAGGIAHDFNNLLTAILAPAELLIETLSGDPESVRDVTEIRDAARRAADLTRQLLAFSRRQVLQPRPLNLNEVVTGMTGMLRRLISEDIDLHTSCAGELGTVRADPSQLEQVLVNLVVNARDAMPNGGRLTIETANVEIDKTHASTQLLVTPGSYVMLSVHDTGAGMSPETQARLWEPFFTTKPKGKGTGLGLSTAYGIVKQSGGYIWAESEPGQGATFKILLPRVEVAADSLATAPLDAPPRGTERLLVVEDDDMVRRVTQRTLTANGYDALVASSGGEALLLAEANAYKFDMLVTDVIMPGMSGGELAERMRAMRPTLKVLFVSGYTDDVVVRHGVLEGDVAFLQKPFTSDSLLRKVKDVLTVG